jgi:hypothetical protein
MLKQNKHSVLLGQACLVVFEDAKSSISGLGWVTYLSPPLANHLWPYISTASALGEIPLEFWLIVMGLNVQRWKEQASAAGMRT